MSIPVKKITIFMIIESKYYAARIIIIILLVLTRKEKVVGPNRDDSRYFVDVNVS